MSHQQCYYEAAANLFASFRSPLWISLLTIPVTYLVYKLFIHPYRSVLSHVPGPRRDHFIFGSMGRVLREQPGVLHIKWAEAFGGVVRYIGIFGVSSHCSRKSREWLLTSIRSSLLLPAHLQEERLVLSDPVALNYILTHAYDFPKPSEIRGRLAQLLGKGMLFAEGQFGWGWGVCQVALLTRILRR